MKCLSIVADHTSRGNAFALFLKSQRKWDNPPLQDEHRDLFKKACVENNYDAALCRSLVSVILSEPG